MVTNTSRSKHEHYVIYQKVLDKGFYGGADIVVPLSYVLKIRDLFQGGGHRPKDATVLLAYVAYMLYRYSAKELTSKYAGWNLLVKNPDTKGLLCGPRTKLNLLEIASWVYYGYGEQSAFMTEYVTPDGTGGPVVAKETPTGISTLWKWLEIETTKLAHAKSVIENAEKTISFE